MFKKLKEYLRLFKITRSLAKEHRIVLSLDNPMFEPTVTLIVTMIRTSDLTNEQIVNLIVYNFNQKFDPTI